MIIIDTNGRERECVSIELDKKWLGYLKVKYFSKIRRTAHVEWYLIKSFLEHNPKLEHLTKGATYSAKEDLGRVSLASSQTLTDKSKKWKTNEFVGYPLWISRGKGESQTREIIMNTEDTLIVKEPWVTVPDKSSQYVISYNVHDPQILGNALSIEHEVKKTKLVKVKAKRGRKTVKAKKRTAKT